MVPGRTRLDSDQARWQCSKETRDIVTAQLPATAHSVYAMRLKHMLGDTQTDCANHAP